MGGRRRSILIVSASIGAGHDGVALEMRTRLTAAGLNAQILDYFELIPSGVSQTIKFTYRVGSRWAPFVLTATFRGRDPRTAGLPIGVGALNRHVAPHLASIVARYDAVISTYPYAAQALGHIADVYRESTPTATFITDPAPHAGWLHPRIHDTWCVSEATALEAALLYQRDLMIVGPIVRDGFRARLLDADAIRRSLGIPLDRRVALIVAGSDALGRIIHTVKILVSSGLFVMVLSGRNNRIRRRLQMERCVVLGWRSDIPELMSASDIVIQNGGGLSCTEALVLGAPVVTFRPIAGHGVANAEVLHRYGYAYWAQSDAELLKVTTSPGVSHRLEDRYGQLLDAVEKLLDVH
jgi:processive 1,2-diacylglycerol beta-glucosyltransferase